MTGKKNDKSSPIDTKQMGELIDKLDSDVTKSTEAILGSFSDDNIDTLHNDLIRKVNTIDNKYSEVVSSDYTALFNAIDMDKQADKNKSTTKQQSSQSKENETIKVAVKELISPNGQYYGMVNDIFYREMDTFNMYRDFDQIKTMIPQIGTVIETYVDTILSPEDYNDSYMNISYNAVDQDSEDVNKVNNYFEDKIQEHKLNRMLVDITDEVVTYGASYVAVQNYSDVINDITARNAMMLSESEILTSTAHSNFKKYLNEETTFLTEEVKTLSELAGEDVADTEVATILEEQFKSMFDFSEGGELLYENNMEGTKVTNDLEMNGTLVYKLKTKCVVPLTNENDYCYGYFYIDRDKNKTFGRSSSSASSRSASPAAAQHFNRLISGPSTGLGAESSEEAKLKLISNLFCDKMEKKLNNKFIKDNPHFKEVIYNILKDKDNLNHAYRVSFFKPENVQRFGTDVNSVLTNVLFTAKMYLGCLLSNFMQRIVQGPEKRIFYMDVGLDKDIPGAINEFASSLKTKEYKMDDLSTIDSTLRKIGTNNDLFIPIKEGKKPIDVEMMPSKQIGYEDEFMEWLRKAIISGCGVPASYVGYTDEVDFSRSLVMQNGRFLRRIIPLQVSIAQDFKELLIKIFNEDHKFNKKEPLTGREKRRNRKSQKAQVKTLVEVFNYDNLTVELPKPTTLMLSQQSDKMRNIEEHIIGVTKIIYGKEDTENEEQMAFRREYAKDLMPGLDWDRINKIRENAKYIAKQDGLDKKANGEEESEEGGGGSGW